MRTVKEYQAELARMEAEWEEIQIAVELDRSRKALELKCGDTEIPQTVKEEYTTPTFEISKPKEKKPTAPAIVHKKTNTGAHELF